MRRASCCAALAVLEKAHPPSEGHRPPPPRLHASVAVACRVVARARAKSSRRAVSRRLPTSRRRKLPVSCFRRVGEARAGRRIARRFPTVRVAGARSLFPRASSRPRVLPPAGKRRHIQAPSCLRRVFASFRSFRCSRARSTSCLPWWLQFRRVRASCSSHPRRGSAFSPLPLMKAARRLRLGQ